MRVSTVRLALLLGLALGVGAIIGAHSDTYAGGDGTYGMYVGPVGLEYSTGTLALWACPEDLGAEVAATLLNCPSDMTPASIRQASEDTRDGMLLTEEMEAVVIGTSPYTDPWQCRYRDVDGATWIVCADGLSMVWAA
jgi:hypothetical protein